MGLMDRWVDREQERIEEAMVHDRERRVEEDAILAEHEEVYGPVTGPDRVEVRVRIFAPGYTDFDLEGLLLMPSFGFSSSS